MPHFLESKSLAASLVAVAIGLALFAPSLWRAWRGSAAGWSWRRRPAGAVDIIRALNQAVAAAAAHGLAVEVKVLPTQNAPEGWSCPFVEAVSKGWSCPFIDAAVATRGEAVR